MRLCRVGGITTAISGAILGCLCSSRQLSPLELLPLLMSACLYLFGMASNDALDVAKDRRLRANRPLARGDLPLESVHRFLGLIGLIFLCTCFFLEPEQRMFYGLSALGILGYNGPLKGLPFLNALSLGCARGFNILGAWGPSQGWVFPSLVFGTVCVYTVTILWVSEGEDSPQAISLKAWLAWALSALGLLVLSGIAALPWCAWTVLQLYLQRSSPPELRPKLTGLLVAAFTLLEASVLLGRGQLLGALAFVSIYGAGRRLSKAFPVG